jgi:hypothetical protein
VFYLAPPPWVQLRDHERIISPVLHDAPYHEELQEFIRAEGELTLRLAVRGMGDLLKKNAPIMLEALANLDDSPSSAVTFIEKFGLAEEESTERIMQLRNDLVKLWDTKPSVRSRGSKWDEWQNSSLRPTLMRWNSMAPFSRGLWNALKKLQSLEIEVLMYPFPTELAVAVGRHWERFKRCPNPKCNGRRFIALRNKYCLGPDCVKSRNAERNRKFYAAHKN